MGQCIGPGVQPPNQNCQKCVTVLRILCAFQFFIMVTAFVTGDGSNGAFSIIFMMLLFCAWRYLQYSIVTFYIFFCILQGVSSLVTLLTIAQNGKNAFPGGMTSAFTAFQIIYCVFYFSACLICFYVYREFKTAAFDKNPAIAQYFQQRNNSIQNQAEGHEVNASDDAFAPNYGRQQNPQRQPPQRTNNRQMFQVFTGKGVVIG